MATKSRSGKEKRRCHLMNRISLAGDEWKRKPAQKMRKKCARDGMAADVAEKRAPYYPHRNGADHLSILLLQHARLIGDATMNFVNAFGVLINAAYIIFYYFWSKKKAQDELVKHLSWSMLAVGLLLFYANLEDPAKVENRFGVVVSIVMLSFIAAPLLSLPEIIEKKSTEGLPYPMIVSGFAVSLLWFVYSLLIWNVLLALQNGIAALLCGFQLYLCSIYPDKPRNAAMKFD